ncbi:unnamed protein product [Effrenium voratum]|nr:unnamed protein product [Effrenium voratum]
MLETRDPITTINEILDGNKPVPAGVAPVAPRDGEPRRGWGSLRPPSARDLKIRRGKGSPLQPVLEHLVVLDFEWTADNRKPVKPISEITQFPSVLVRLDGSKSMVVDEFNSYVRPTLNPRLPKFSVELTGITQEMVDSSPCLQEVLPQYLEWLKSHALVSPDLSRQGRWAFCTWSDADIGGQLGRELRFKGLEIPRCFDQWVDLKILYKRHYRLEPRGLQRSVERLGLDFAGRAHDGLVDSRNTAAIVLHMARGSMLYGAFTFRRPTRGLDKHGFAFGSKESRKRRLEEDEALGQFRQLLPAITMEVSFGQMPMRQGWQKDALHVE